MRRAVIAAAGTVVGLVALLDYRSAGTVHRSTIGLAGAPGATSTTPTPAPSGPTSAPAGAAAGGTGSPGPSTPAAAPARSRPATAGQGPTSGAPASRGPAAAAYTGVDVPYNYGDIQLAITVAGGRITHIAVPHESATDPRSAFINAQAVPILIQEALAAQSLNFDVVSGATFTSEAFGQAFSSALGKAGR